jgi:hypothetical protein
MLFFLASRRSESQDWKRQKLGSGRVFLESPWNGKSKFGPRTRLAFDRDFPIQEIEVSSHDVQTESNATELTRVRVIELFERVENPAEILLGDADPGIRNAKFNPVLLGTMTHLDFDMARRRKLKGVADQILQDLFDLERIGG